MTKRKPGRPRKVEDDLYVRVSITLPRPEAEWLKAQPGGASKWVAEKVSVRREIEAVLMEEHGL